MRQDEIGGYGYGEDAAGHVTGVVTHANTRVSNSGDIFIGGDVNEESHATFPIAGKRWVLNGSLTVRPGSSARAFDRLCGNGVGSGLDAQFDNRFLERQIEQITDTDGHQVTTCPHTAKIVRTGKVHPFQQSSDVRKDDIMG